MRLAITSALWSAAAAAAPLQEIEPNDDLLTAQMLDIAPCTSADVQGRLEPGELDKFRLPTRHKSIAMVELLHDQSDDGGRTVTVTHSAADVIRWRDSSQERGEHDMVVHEIDGDYGGFPIVDITVSDRSTAGAWDYTLRAWYCDAGPVTAGVGSEQEPNDSFKMADQLDPSTRGVPIEGEAGGELQWSGHDWFRVTHEGPDYAAISFELAVEGGPVTGEVFTLPHDKSAEEFPAPTLGHGQMSAVDGKLAFEPVLVAPGESVSFRALSDDDARGTYRLTWRDGAPAACASDDPFERRNPDDPFGAPVLGSSAPEPGLLTSPGEVDRFAFDVQLRSEIALSLRPPEGADYELTLLQPDDSGWTVLGSSALADDAEETVELVLDPGRYYVEVSGHHGACSDAAYELSLDSRTVPVVLVPGVGGSRLRTDQPLLSHDGEHLDVWLDCNLVLDEDVEDWLELDFDGVGYRPGYLGIGLEPSPGDHGLRAIGSLLTGSELCKAAAQRYLNAKSKAVYYQPLIEELVGLGYEPGTTLFGAPYDWRYDYGALADGLGDRVDEVVGIAGTQTATVVAHSLGAGAVQYGLEVGAFGGRVGRVIYAGGAIRGAALAIRTHKFGYDLGVGLNDERMIELSAEWGSVYSASPYASYYERLAELDQTPYEQWPFIPDEEWSTATLPRPQGSVTFSHVEYMETLADHDLADMAAWHHRHEPSGTSTDSIYVVGVGKLTAYRMIDSENFSGPLMPRTNGDGTIPAFAQYRDDGRVFCLADTGHRELIGFRGRPFMGPLIAGDLDAARDSKLVDPSCDGPDVSEELVVTPGVFGGDVVGVFIYEDGLSEVEVRGDGYSVISGDADVEGTFDAETGAFSLHLPVEPGAELWLETEGSAVPVTVEHRRYDSSGNPVEIVQFAPDPDSPNHDVVIDLAESRARVFSGDEPRTGRWFGHQP